MLNNRYYFFFAYVIPILIRNVSFLDPLTIWECIVDCKTLTSPFHCGTKGFRNSPWVLYQQVEYYMVDIGLRHLLLRTCSFAVCKQQKVRENAVCKQQMIIFVSHNTKI